MLTLRYSVRLAYYVFFKNLRGRGVINLREEEGILTPISVLLGLSIVAGALIRVTCFPATFIYLPILVKGSVIAGLFIILIFLFYYINLKNIQQLSGVSKLVFYIGRIWFLPFISRVLFIPAFKLGELILKSSDQGWLEYFGGKGVIKNLSLTRSRIDLFNLINLKYYIFMFFTLLVFFVLI